MTEELIAPHGGTLINRAAAADEASSLQEQAKSLPLLRLTSRALSDLELIANGGMSPLEGFMTQAQYHSVVKEMHLPNGDVWSLPVTVAASREAAEGRRGDHRSSSVSKLNVKGLVVRNALAWNRNGNNRRRD